MSKSTSKQPMGKQQQLLAKPTISQMSYTHPASSPLAATEFMTPVIASLNAPKSGTGIECFQVNKKSSSPPRCCTIDCGVAVQPNNVIAQQESSIVYGLGVALTEIITIKNGVVEQSNFYDYHVPRMKDVPPMHIEVIQTDNHPTGAGQMATPLVAPAIANAVAERTGVRLRHTPFLPDRVKKALG